MMELTPLVADSTRGGSRRGLTEEAPRKGGSWKKMTLVALAIVGIVAVGSGLVVPKMNDGDVRSMVTPKEAVLAKAKAHAAAPKVTDDFAQCGPKAATKGPSHVYVVGRVIGCDGPFTGGMLSTSAAELCDAANGWRVCTGAADAMAQGLTKALCLATPNGKFYATQQKGSGFHKCDNVGTNDVFGCSTGLGLATNLAADCNPLTSTGGNKFGSYNGKQWSCASCAPDGLNELVRIKHELNGDTVYDGGVMCCKNAPKCPPGKYLSSGQCNACPAGYFCANGVKTICPAGQYQANPGMATCVQAKCGYHVPAPGATMEQQCRAGTFSKIGASSCTPVGKGEYSGAGACAPSKCKEGTYQDCEGQAQCNPAPCGHYVSGTGQTGYTECPAGQYQPQGGQSSCLDVPMGSYSGKGHCKPRLCMPGTFQPKAGQPSCNKAQCGYFVSTPGSTKEEMCANGFYQPEQGQPTCLGIPDGHIAIQNACAIECCKAGTYRTPAFTCVDAPCGKKVPGTCAMAPMACPPGEYTDAAGASSCKKSPLGSIPNADQCGTKKCDPGKYQDVVGGTECKTVRCGHFTKDPGSPSESKCPMGTYQDKPGKTGCIPCKAGTANKELGKCSCPDCAKGTYQPDTGKQTCKDAPCGTFVPGTGATQTQPCPPGEYQDQTGQWMCKPAPAGSFAVGNTCNPETCPAGTYTGSDGQVKCTSAQCGHYVQSAGQTSETPCPAGQYQPLVGQTSCLDAPTGSYTSGAGSCEETLCTPGNFQPQTGQQMCQPADCGHYVAISGSATQSPCGPGRFQPDKGKTGCNKAAQGKFVAGKGSCKQDPCPTGSYTDCEGQSECIKAPCGYFVDTAGKKGMTQCAAGTYQDLAGQSKCLPNPPGTFTKIGYCKAQQCDPGTFQPLGGQDTCKAASCGNFVDGEGRKAEKKCAAGSYQPKAGQVGCLPTTYGNAPNPGTCTKGNVAGGIFYAGPSTMTWEDAKKYCMSNGDRLAIVKSQMEHDEVKGVCPATSKHCWLGASDIAKEGTWRWVDGSLVNSGFKNWGKNEPNGAKTENCMMTFCAGDCWNDAPCGNKFHPVCERRLPRPQMGISFHAIGSLAKATECFSGNCYQVTPSGTPSALSFGAGGFMTMDGTGYGFFAGTEKKYPTLGVAAPSLTVYAKFAIASDITDKDWFPIFAKSKGFHERGWMLWGILVDNRQNIHFLFQGGYGSTWFQAGFKVSATFNVPMTLTGVYDKGTKGLKLYINGVLKNQVTMPQPMVSRDAPVRVGGLTFHLPFKGKIYELAYYEFAMSTAQVMELNSLGVKCPNW